MRLLQGFFGTPLLDVWGHLVAVLVGRESEFPHAEPSDSASQKIVEGILELVRNPVSEAVSARVLQDLVEVQLK